MTDNELLLAMSNMMDDKLKPVNDRLESMEQGQEEMSGRLERVEQNQEEMSGRLKRVEQGQEEMSGRLERVERTQEEMSDKMDKEFELVNDRLERVEQGQEEMSGKLERVKQNQEEMSGRLKRLEIDHENEILPRLQTIEKCYVSTYERYQEGVDQIQKMHDDISVIKYIVTQHSEQFQKLQVANS